MISFLSQRRRRDCKDNSSSQLPESTVSSSTSHFQHEWREWKQKQDVELKTLREETVKSSWCCWHSDILHLHKQLTECFELCFGLHQPLKSKISRCVSAVLWPAACAQLTEFESNTKPKNHSTKRSNSTERFILISQADACSVLHRYNPQNRCQPTDLHLLYYFFVSENWAVVFVVSTSNHFDHTQHCLHQRATV